MNINKLKENNYQIPIIIGIILLCLFAINNKKSIKNTEINIDSIRTYYSHKVESLDSIHKHTITTLKTSFSNELKEKEMSISKLSSKNTLKEKTITKLSIKLQESENTFFRMESGEVKINDFYAKGTNIIYKKSELTNLVKTNDKSTEYQNEIKTLSSNKILLEKSNKTLSNTLSIYEHSIDSLIKNSSELTEEITKLNKNVKITSESTYNINASVYGIYSKGFNNELNVAFKKYILTIPIIKSKLFIEGKYINENVILFQTGHVFKAGVGIEL